MKYIQSLLVAILLVSGAFIWFNFYTSFQEKKEVANHPTSSPSQEEEKVPPPAEENSKSKVATPYSHQNGLTHEMIKEWNVEDERISIDRLLSLLEKNKP